MLLGEGRKLRVAIDRRRRRKHNRSNVILDHSFEQNQAVGDVVAVILGRVFNRLCHEAAGTKVNNRLDGILAENLV